LNIQVQVRLSEDDQRLLDALVAAIKVELEGSGAPEPTRASVLRGLMIREAKARGLDKPNRPDPATKPEKRAKTGA
jgi:hypothetical protein